MINATEFDARVTQMNYRYPSGILRGQLNLLDSHDVNRFFSYCRGDIRRLRLAEIFLFMAPGVPCVFYGDELGMNGDTEYTLRGPMPWTDATYDEREFFKKLISLRSNNETLIYGKYRKLFTDDKGLYVFERSYNKDVITVAINARDIVAAIPDLVPEYEPLMSFSFTCNELGPFGYAIWS